MTTLVEGSYTVRNDPVVPTNPSVTITAVMSAHETHVHRLCDDRLYDAALAYIVAPTIPEAAQQLVTGETFGLDEWLADSD